MERVRSRVLLLRAPSRTVPFRENGLTHVYRCTKTVPKHIELGVLGLVLSEKQIPQIVENNQSGTERMEPLEGTGVRPRQVRYQAALRPDSRVS